jgi:hypothetical protein
MISVKRLAKYLVETGWRVSGDPVVYYRDFIINYT